jgi:hypothetical protein
MPWHSQGFLVNMRGAKLCRRTFMPVTLVRCNLRNISHLARMRYAPVQPVKAQCVESCNPSGLHLRVAVGISTITVLPPKKAARPMRLPLPHPLPQRVTLLLRQLHLQRQLRRPLLPPLPLLRPRRRASLRMPKYGQFFAPASCRCGGDFSQ